MDWDGKIMQQIEQRRSSRYSKGEQRVIRTDTNETVRKLRSLTERARLYGRAEGSLVPVEALVTIETEHWVWQTVDREPLSELTHRLVLQMRDGRRRELFMTHSLDAAVESASRIVEFHDGVVLVEALAP
ncbi:MAG: hypothetical protein CMB31_04495 [Euryarchaeota archaeon]|nr:hypothetical protein [Euryarchaeota archaeon]